MGYDNMVFVYFKNTRKEKKQLEKLLEYLEEYNVYYCSWEEKVDLEGKYLKTVVELDEEDYKLYQKEDIDRDFVLHQLIQVVNHLCYTLDCDEDQEVCDRLDRCMKILEKEKK